ILALWDSPRQREACDWFTVELANLRTAFRWAADQGDLDDGATVATYAGLLGAGVQTYEPIAWVEELIEPARAVDHPRLAFLYAIASLCYTTGRIEAAVGYSDAGRSLSAGAARRCRTAWKPGLDLYTSPSGSPSGWPSCAAPSSHAAATPTSTSGHVWLPP